MFATSTLPLRSGTYALDRAHSSVCFKFRHLGLCMIRGTFRSFDAILTVGEGLDDVVVSATIDAASIDTNQPGRDAHLLSPDFLDTDAHPQVMFRSTGAREVNVDHYSLSGDLTLRGVTNPVTLDVAFTGTAVNPVDGALRAGFTARTEIRRSDYGIDLNFPLADGTLGVAEKVQVALDLQFIAPTPSIDERR